VAPRCARGLCQRRRPGRPPAARRAWRGARGAPQRPAAGWDAFLPRWGQHGWVSSAATLAARAPAAWSTQPAVNAALCPCAAATPLAGGRAVTRGRIATRRCFWRRGRAVKAPACLPRRRAAMRPRAWVPVRGHQGAHAHNRAQGAACLPHLHPYAGGITAWRRSASRRLGGGRMTGGSRLAGGGGAGAPARRAGVTRAVRVPCLSQRGGPAPRPPHTSSAPRPEGIALGQAAHRPLTRGVDLVVWPDPARSHSPRAPAARREAPGASRRASAREPGPAPARGARGAHLRKWPARPRGHGARPELPAVLPGSADAQRHGPPPGRQRRRGGRRRRPAAAAAAGAAAATAALT
jgi:hypothetical protein